MCIRDRYKIDIKSETQAIESGELPENYMELSEGVYEEEMYEEPYEEDYEEGYEEDAYPEDEIEFEEVDDTEE